MNNNFVFAVLGATDYEGSEVLSIWLTLEEAKAEAKAQVKDGWHDRYLVNRIPVGVSSKYSNDDTVAFFDPPTMEERR